jgi:hypothetical protein
MAPVFDRLIRAAQQDERIASGRPSIVHAQSALHNLVTSPALWPAVHPLETLPSMSDVIAE